MILRITVTGGTNASWRKRALFILFSISEYVYVVSMCTHEQKLEADLGVLPHGCPPYHSEMVSH